MLVMRGDNDGKRLARRRDFLFFPSPHPTKTDDEEIHRKQENQELHRDHDDVKYVCHVPSASLYQNAQGIDNPENRVRRENGNGQSRQ